MSKRMINQITAHLDADDFYRLIPCCERTTDRRARNLVQWTEGFSLFLTP